MTKLKTYASFIELKQGVVTTFVRFGLVGSIGFLVDFGSTFLMKELFGVDAYIANGGGFMLAVVNNYLLNKYWTFSEKSPISLQQFSFFLLISLIGLVINTLLVALLYGTFAANFYAAKILATLVVMTWNFLANKLWVFKLRTSLEN